MSTQYRQGKPRLQVVGCSASVSGDGGSPLVSSSEVARIVGRSESEIRRHVREGRLTPAVRGSTRSGGHRFTIAEAERFRDALAKASRAEPPPEARAYDGRTVAEVFADLDEGKSLRRIVIERQLVPDVVADLAERYAAFGAGRAVFLSRDDVSRLAALDVDPACLVATVEAEIADANARTSSATKLAAERARSASEKYAADHAIVTERLRAVIAERDERIAELAEELQLARDNEAAEAERGNAAVRAQCEAEDALKLARLTIDVQARMAAMTTSTTDVVVESTEMQSKTPDRDPRRPGTGEPSCSAEIPADGSVPAA